MKNGLKVFDTDTHLAPSAETLRPYLPATVIERIPDLEEHKVPLRMSVTREPLEPPFKHAYRFRGDNAENAGFGANHARFLGEAGPEIDRGRGLTDATFLAGDCDRASHRHGESGPP